MDTADDDLDLRPCGDAAVLIDLPDNHSVHALAESVRAAAIPGVGELVPGLRTLLIEHDGLSLATLRAALTPLRLAPPSDKAPVAENVEEHRIPVRYDGADLDEVCSRTSLSRGEVVAAHTGSSWTVAFCGFAPGFAYLIGGDERLRVPRRGEARTRVPAGSVGLAGEFSAVYPRESPGGWQIIGTSDVPLWDPSQSPPATLLPGMRVRFEEAAP